MRDFIKIKVSDHHPVRDPLLPMTDLYKRYGKAAVIYATTQVGTDPQAIVDFFNHYGINPENY